MIPDQIGKFFSSYYRLLERAAFFGFNIEKFVQSKSLALKQMCKGVRYRRHQGTLDSSIK